MICTKKTALLTLSLATTWSFNALALPANNISKPPVEAYTACEGKKLGEQASFVSEMGNTIAGLCEQQHDGRLILKPDHLIRSNAIPPAAYQECVGKKLGDAVQITIPTGQTISGTCQADGDRLYFRLDPPPSMHAGMKTHSGGQFLELQNESKQPDTQQQAPDQNQDDSSQQEDTPQQESIAPEELHSNAQQEQQAGAPNSADKPEEQQTQPQPPPRQPEEKPQEKPKGFLGKVKDFFTNLW